MRFLLRRFLSAMVFSLCLSCEAWSQFPSPQFNAVTAQSITTGSFTSTGSNTISGGGSLVGTYTGPTVFTNVQPSITPVTISSLPTVTSANKGQLAYVSDCINSSQSAPGSGCLYFVNTNGTWTPMPSPSNLTVTIGGQAIFFGGATANQGNGAKIQLATGGFITGHALAFDNNGNAIDSGVVPSGGTGGGGTVASAPQNSIPFYTNAGTASTVGGLAIVNNAVVATNASGVPAETTTLPIGLTIPSPTISNPTLGGTITISAASYTGKQTYAASTLGSASLNVPVGVTPSAPANGDVWASTTGLLGWFNGAQQGPYIGRINTVGPITGAGVGPTLSLSCPTCATTANGGTLSATAPMAISASGIISLGGQPSPVTWIADSATVVHNDTYNLYEKWPFANSGTINSIVYHTGGSSSPAFSLSILVNGVNVTGCNAITVSSTSDTTATCTGLNTIAAGQTVALAISGVTGSPSSALVQINMTKPAS